MKTKRNVNLKGRENLKSTDRFTPSPTMRVRFGDGKVVPLNRAARRSRKIFTSNLRKISKTQIIEKNG